VLLVVLGVCTKGTLSRAKDVQFFCPNHNPQKAVDLNKVSCLVPVVAFEL